MQSSKWDYPITVLLEKDSKETYERYIRPIFQFTEKLKTEGLGEWLPFYVAEPQYTKSLQLCLARGSAAKVKPHCVRYTLMTLQYSSKCVAVTVTVWTIVVPGVSC
jgi:hypothetical protein